MNRYLAYLAAFGILLFSSALIMADQEGEMTGTAEETSGIETEVTSETVTVNETEIETETADETVTESTTEDRYDFESSRFYDVNIHGWLIDDYDLKEYPDPNAPSVASVQKGQEVIVSGCDYTSCWAITYIDDHECYLNLTYVIWTNPEETDMSCHYILPDDVMEEASVEAMNAVYDD